MPSQAARLHFGCVFHHKPERNGDLARLADLQIGGKEANARVLFKKIVNTVKHARVVACNAQGILIGFDLVAVLLKCGIHRNRDGVAILADGNTLLLQIFCKLLGCVACRRFTARRDKNRG